MNRVIVVLLCLILASCVQERHFSVIPQPAEVILGDGRFDVAGVDLYVEEGLDSGVVSIAGVLASELGVVTGKESLLAGHPAVGQIGFYAADGLPSEGYRLTVDGNGIRIEAGDYNGFFYAVQTLRQMLPVQIYGKERARVDWSVRYVDVKDYPRFEYRGLLLDPARWFFTVEETKKVLDAMALYKLNRLHWHLTDDQGWRWEVKKYPELTRCGAWRDGSCTRPYIESYDNIPHGGFYTQEELREIVAYAASRGIDIIPEIDLPGHMVAALTAYPQLGCTGGPYEIYRRWGVTEDILCAGKDEVFDFIEDLLDELIDIFPYEYVHIGGDECPRTRWETCPACQARIRQLGLSDGEGVSAEARLQNYVMERVQKMLEERGRKVACWNEAIEGDLDRNITVFAWCDGKIGSEPGAETALRGYETVMCNIDDLYFIWPQNPDVASEPYTAYRRITLPAMRVYGYEPLAELAPGTEKFVKGVQGHIWCNYIPTMDILEYSMLPRLCALSEVQWCAAENKNEERFRASMEHSFRILDELGYEYCPCLDENPERERYKGTYRNYDFDAQTVNEPAPKGYEAFYISHFGRNGASGLTCEGEYDAVAKVLGEASLTSLGEEIKARFYEICPQVREYASRLTPVGCEQQQMLAKRLCKAWPEVLRGGCDAEAWSLDDELSISSMNAFLGSLYDCRPSVRVSTAVLPVLKVEPAEDVDADKTLYNFSNPDMLYERLFTDADAAERLHDVPAFVSSLYHFCTHLECVGVKDDVMEKSFTDEHASAMAFVDDYLYSSRSGWAKAVNVASAWPLLEHFVSVADRNVASGQKGVSLRFGDENALMAMMSLLKMGIYSERLFDCDDVPMAANIRWVFAGNKAGDILVKVQYNESDRMGWMPWSEFRDYCVEQIEWAKEALK